jgi:phosphoglycerate dehydrogenase-like enzyme
MNRTPRVMLAWDGEIPKFLGRDQFAALDDYGVELVTVTLGAMPAPEPALVEALQGMDAMFVVFETISRAILERVPSLRLVQRFGAGYDRIDVAAATELGVLVAVTPGANAEAVAEHAFALMLAVVGRIPSYDREVKEGTWQLARIRGDLKGATLGIVGLGRIGREIAKRASAFGMNVLAHDLVRDEVFAREQHVTYGSLHKVLSAADIVSLNVALNDQTRGLIDREALATMRPSAYLVNTARGPVVDEDAVCEALAAGRLAGYATDVFAETPPPPDHALLHLDNVVATPWVAAASVGANRRMVDMAVECVGKVLTGHPAPEGCVLNPEALAARRGEG